MRGPPAFPTQRVSVTSAPEPEKSLPMTGHGSSSTRHTTAQGPTGSTSITAFTLVEESLLGSTDGTHTSFLSEAKQST